MHIILQNSQVTVTTDQVRGNANDHINFLSVNYYFLSYQHNSML
ncbi:MULTISPECIES: hypothetical protein [unclassified Mucilaginibacter]|nr:MULTISPECIES: hypothetical protein [unclassified Mucilaginibacter]MEB0261970.1 hypothetical protein [Mucilaginibacter sp. 10I4]MEB0277270.1 hypothetical protein [Mucilaginibacter sp. 10B2]MEB0300866.1 hypothetical protein [Mucilaginibacter sp. 5C4]